ncbi:hypothetical protein IW261DRAFT_1421611 [Armillaria novae-zelandiae]|uniref:Uncharacterized protein n=1 Tax=Armillaria novae-zelandiae TaxID=153914 RepID=A0AA39P2E6_9AGAR|nr:hypothetical protein IW261DRAFT_1421611 [Armillaria novae-zelandiae]
MWWYIFSSEVIGRGTYHDFLVSCVIMAHSLECVVMDVVGVIMVSVGSGSVHTLVQAVDAHSIEPMKLSKPSNIIVLCDVGNFNEQYMSMYNSKWVIHLSKPVGTMFERDWDVFRMSKNMGCSSLMKLVADAALAKYVPKVDPKFQEGLAELKQWWKLNVLKIMDDKGEIMSIEKSMERSLVEMTFTIKHNFISNKRTDSFSAIISSSRIMVSGKHYHEAMDSYQSYMDTTRTHEEQDEDNPRKCKGQSGGTE